MNLWWLSTIAGLQIPISSFFDETQELLPGKDATVNKTISFMELLFKIAIADN